MCVLLGERDSVKQRAQYSHTDYYGLAGSPTLLRLDLVHLCHLCPAETRTNYFSSSLLALPHFFSSHQMDHGNVSGKNTLMLYRSGTDIIESTIGPRG